MTRDVRVLQRFRWLAPTNATLLAEATMALAGAAVIIAFFPFRRLGALLGRRGATLRPPGADERRVRQIRWAVEAAAKRVPWRAVCFQKGVALHWMLRRRGIPTRLHYGVGKSPENQLAAHVWVSLDGATLMGGEVAHNFTCLATYPSDAPDPK